MNERDAFLHLLKRHGTPFRFRLSPVTHLAEIANLLRKEMVNDLKVPSKMESFHLEKTESPSVSPIKLSNEVSTLTDENKN